MKRLIAFALVFAAWAPAVTAQTSAGFTGRWEGDGRLQGEMTTEFNGATGRARIDAAKAK